MKLHKLKTKAEAFDAIVRGAKRFEFRLNDRDYEVGDILELHRIEKGVDGIGISFTGETMKVEVTYLLRVVTQDCQDHCVMSIVPRVFSMGCIVEQDIGVKRIDVVYTNDERDEIDLGK